MTHRDITPPNFPESEVRFEEFEGKIHLSAFSFGKTFFVIFFSPRLPMLIAGKHFPSCRIVVPLWQLTWSYMSAADGMGNIA